MSDDLILKLNEVTVDNEQQNGQYDKLFKGMVPNPHIEKVEERKRYIADSVPRVGIKEEVVRNWNFKFTKEK